MILITGAGGTVSREVATALAGRAPVRLALRDTGLRDAQAPDRVRFDFLDPATFAPALAGVDRVFLRRPPDLARATHDFGPFIAAMRAAAIAQVVFLSVRGAADNPLLPHHRIERLLEKSGLAWTHLRPNDFMQNFATVHRADIRDLGQIWVPAGHGRTSFVDVRDVGEAAARVLTEPGDERRAYTLTGGAAFSLDEVAAIMSDVLHRRIVYRNPGIPAFIRHGRVSHRPLALSLVMSAIGTVARLGLAAEVTTDLPRLIERAPTELRKFVQDYAACWQLEIPTG